MEEEGISSIELMERAATKVFQQLDEIVRGNAVSIFCGSGNNGGDGLAIARLMLEKGYKCRVFLLDKKKGTPEYEANLKWIKASGNIIYLQDLKKLPDLDEDAIVDCIFGIGLNRPVTGFYKKVIDHINSFNNIVFSIDIPSGMYADKPYDGGSVINANLTYTFTSMKRAFFIKQTGESAGHVRVIDLWLSSCDFEFLVNFSTIDSNYTDSIHRYRKKFSNKGDYGSACLIAGSYGMMGAAVLSAHGCLRSGVGKLTCFICEKGYDIMQIKTPEALCKVFGVDHVENIGEVKDYNVVGVGPGLGPFESHVKLLEKLFRSKMQLVLDADALNTISNHKELLNSIPENTIITPHPKEFERLFGKTAGEMEAQNLALEKAYEYGIYIILKGRYTFIATPSNAAYYNETGNAGMATAGSGDVLTGIITGLLAQGYEPEDACKFGVYLHGLAGDLAAEDISQEALIASDIYKYLGKAFQFVERPQFMNGEDDFL